MNKCISSLKNKRTRSMLIQGVCFALCFFAFQLTEFTVNDRAVALLGADRVIAVYSVGILCTALGFLSFSLLRRIFHGERARKAVICVIGVLVVVSASFLLTVEQASLFIISAAAALFSLGNIGGCVYYNCAMTFQNSRYVGRIIGIGMGTAVMLQCIVQNLLLEKAAFIISVTASVAVLIWFVIRPPRDWMFENPLPYSAENKTDRKAAGILIAAVVLMSVVCALLDGIVVPAHAAGQTSVSDFIRLFYAASLVAAGFTADIRERKYLSLVTVCLMFLSTVSGAFFTNSAALWLGTVLIYIYSGFYVVFLTVRFFDLAVKSKNPALWAGMGRIVRSLTVAAAAMPTALLCRTFGNISLVAGSCVLSIIIMLLLLRDISPLFAPKKENTKTNEAGMVKSGAVGEEERLKLFSDKYALTPRESEVLAHITSSSKNIQEIAYELYLSRRTLQRYLTSIYEKTDTKSRIMLIYLYLNGITED